MLEDEVDISGHELIKSTGDATAILTDTDFKPTPEEKKRMQRRIGFSTEPADTRCPAHPRYTGRGKPRNCPACRRRFFAEHP